MNRRRLLLVFLGLVALGIGTVSEGNQASAWWRGDGDFRGGWGDGYGGGCRWGGCDGVGAGVAAGLAGLAVGAIAGAALGASSGSYPPPGYAGPPAYGCVQHPNYDEWGRFVGYSC